VCLLSIDVDQADPASKNKVTESEKSLCVASGRTQLIPMTMHKKMRQWTNQHQRQQDERAN
jgi:hypothetical protein